MKQELPIGVRGLAVTREFTIDRVENGYILRDFRGTGKVFTRIEDLFQELLSGLESKDSWVSEDSLMFGKVIIARGQGNGEPPQLSHPIPKHWRADGT